MSLSRGDHNVVKAVTTNRTDIAVIATSGTGRCIPDIVIGFTADCSFPVILIGVSTNRAGVFGISLILASGRNNVFLIVVASSLNHFSLGFATGITGVDHHPDGLTIGFLCHFALIPSMTQRRDFFLGSQSLTAYRALHASGQTGLLTGSVLTSNGFFRVAGSGNVLSLGSTTSTAGVGLHTSTFTVGIGRHNTGIPAMAQRRDLFLSSQNFAANRALHTSGQASLLTSGVLADNGFLRVAQCIDCFSLGLAASTTSVGLHTRTLAAGRNRHNAFVPTVAQCVNISILIAHAAAFADIRCISLLHTGRSRHNAFSVTMAFAGAHISSANVTLVVIALFINMTQCAHIRLFTAAFCTTDRAVDNSLIRTGFRAGRSLIIFDHSFCRSMAGRHDLTILVTVSTNRAGMCRIARLRTGRSRHCRIVVVSNRCDLFGIRTTAGTASKCLHTNTLTVGLGRHNAFAPAVTQSRNLRLSSQHLATGGTLHADSQAGLLAGCILAGDRLLDVAQSRDLCLGSQHLATCDTLHTGSQAVFLAGCVLAGDCLLGVAQSRSLFLCSQSLTANGTLHTGSQTSLLTGCVLTGNSFLRVAGGIDDLGISMRSIVLAGVGHQTCLRTSRCHRFNANIVMSQSRRFICHSAAATISASRSRVATTFTSRFRHNTAPLMTQLGNRLSFRMSGIVLTGIGHDTARIAGGRNRHNTLVPCVAGSVNVLALGFAAGRTSKGLYARAHAAGSGAHNTVVPSMAQCIDRLLCSQRLTTNGALHAVGQAGLFTGGVLTGNRLLGVAQSAHSLRLGITAGAAGIGHHTVILAGRSNGLHALAPIMAQSGNSLLRNQDLTTGRALLALSQTGILAGRRHSDEDLLGVGDGCKFLGIGVAASAAGVGFHTHGGAGGLGGHFAGIAVTQRSNHGVRVDILTSGAGMGGVAILRTGGGGHNALIVVAQSRITSTLGNISTLTAGIDNLAFLFAGRINKHRMILMLARRGNHLGVSMCFIRLTGIGFYTGLAAGSLDSLHTLIPVMPQSSNCLGIGVGGIILTGIGSHAFRVTGGHGGHFALVVVPQRIFRDIRAAHFRAALGTVHNTIIGSCLYASSGNLIFFLLVTFLMAVAQTYAAGIARQISICIYMDAGCRNAFRIRLFTCLTGEGLFTRSNTGRRCSHLTGVIAVPFAVCIGIRSAVSCGFFVCAIGVLQLSRGDRNLNITCSLNQLMGYSLRSSLHLDLTAVGTINIGTTGSGVNIARRCINRTVDFDCCINQICLCAGIVLTRCIGNGDQDFIIRSAIIGPFIHIVKISTASAIQCAGGSFSYDDFRSRQECHILFQNNGSLFHIYCNITVDGQFKVFRVDGRCTHTHVNRSQFQISICFYHQAVCITVITFYNISGRQIEHSSACCNKCHSRRKICAGHVNSGTGILFCSRIERHGHFNILDIVLTQREYAVFHLGRLVTTTKVHELEALVDCAATLDRHFAEAVDKTICIQGAAAVNSNTASVFHLHETSRAGGRAAIRFTALRISLLSRNTHSAIDGEVCAICHRQSSISSWGNIVTCIQHVCCKHRVIAVKGD